MQKDGRVKIPGERMGTPCTRKNTKVGDIVYATRKFPPPDIFMKQCTYLGKESHFYTQSLRVTHRGYTGVALETTGCSPERFSGWFGDFYHPADCLISNFGKDRKPRVGDKAYANKWLIMLGLKTTTGRYYNELLGIPMRVTQVRDKQISAEPWSKSDKRLGCLEKTGTGHFFRIIETYEYERSLDMEYRFKKAKDYTESIIHNALTDVKAEFNSKAKSSPSKKAKEAAEAIIAGDFGCNEESVRRLVSVLIDEDIPGDEDEYPVGLPIVVAGAAAVYVGENRVVFPHSYYGDSPEGTDIAGEKTKVATVRQVESLAKDLSGTPEAASRAMGVLLFTP